MKADAGAGASPATGLETDSPRLTAAQGVDRRYVYAHAAPRRAAMCSR